MVTPTVDLEETIMIIKQTFIGALLSTTHAAPGGTSGGGAHSEGRHAYTIHTIIRPPHAHPTHTAARRRRVSYWTASVGSLVICRSPSTTGSFRQQRPGLPSAYTGRRQVRAPSLHMAMHMISCSGLFARRPSGVRGTGSHSHTRTYSTTKLTQNPTVRPSIMQI